MLLMDAVVLVVVCGGDDNGTDDERKRLCCTGFKVRMVFALRFCGICSLHLCHTVKINVIRSCYTCMR